MGTSFQILCLKNLEISIDVDYDDDHKVNRIDLTIGSGFTEFNNPSINAEFPLTLEDLDQVIEKLQADKEVNLTSVANPPTKEKQ